MTPLEHQCPTCAADPGQPCTFGPRSRRTFHLGRQARWARQVGSLRLGEVPAVKAVLHCATCVVVVCPFCGREHTHGSVPGLRLSHCTTTTPRHYEIKEIVL